MNPLITGLFLMACNAFFVAAEYALVGARRTRVQQDAAKGSAAARAFAATLEDKDRYVAGIQLGVTVFSIAIGAVLEPYLSRLIEAAFPGLPDAVSSSLSILVVSYPLVVLGELVPKYATLRHAETIGYFVARPLRIWVGLTLPLIWLYHFSGKLLLRLIRIDMDQAQEESLSREEYRLLLQAGEESGTFNEHHADALLGALNLNKLDARDIMVHRLDIAHLRLEIGRDALIAEAKKLRHHRIPVIGEDMDDIRGIVYLQDLVWLLTDPGVSLESILKPVVYIPENLTLDRALQTMRTNQTQILIVQDEYGGTSGMLTLEDLVEEILGDLQDKPESEEAEIRPGALPNSLSLSPYVRWDELLEEVGQEVNEDTPTDTVATLVVTRLDRAPQLFDEVEADFGRLRVTNLARRRIQRILWVPPAGYELPATAENREATTP
ncbi:MAG: hemolysin family protein [Fimbriimonadaceae bacterium]|nr:hemolysin family protein [Fimbriimonadaceae bacterium]